MNESFRAHSDHRRIFYDKILPCAKRSQAEPGTPTIRVRNLFVDSDTEALRYDVIKQGGGDRNAITSTVNAYGLKSNVT